MNNYRSYGGQKSRKGKWIIALIFLAFAAFKIYNRNLSPALSFADESKLSIPVVEPNIEDSSPLPATTPKTTSPISEPNLPRIADLSPESDPEAMTSFDDIMACIETNPSGIIEARDRLNKMLSKTMSQQQLSFIKKQLSALSEKWLFSKDVFPEDKLCSRYKVKEGDTPIAIGKMFNVPYEILMQINNISNPEALRAGETIKVIKGPFHCRIYRSTFTMDLFLQDTLIRSFIVGLGESGMETPTGRWIVKPGGKMLSPTWTDHDTGKTYSAQDPGYPLGARWIALEGVEGDAKGRTGFAIHGTKDPQQLGMAESRGCIRLYNDDVKLVYNLFMPGVSQVVVE